MFQSEPLNNHLKASHTIASAQEVFLELNLNQADNIEKLGNYRYRPALAGSVFASIKATYDDDSGLIKYYTGATDSDIVVDNGFDDDDEPISFITKKKKLNLLY